MQSAALAVLIGATGAVPATAQTLETDGTEVISLAEWRYEDLYAGAMSAEEFIDDMVVYTRNGENVGDVEDLVASQDGKILAVIAEVGGVWDIGDTHVSVPWSEVKMNGDGVTVPVTEETIQDYGLFDQDPLTSEEARGEMVGAMDDTATGQRAFRISELIGDYARLRAGPGNGAADDADGQEQARQDGAQQQAGQQDEGGSGQARQQAEAEQADRTQQQAGTAADAPRMINYGYVRDVMIKDGEIAAVIVNPDIGYGAPGYYTAYPYYGNRYEPGSRYYDMPYTPQDIADMSEFDYEEVQAM
jgi:sporulation protein YlmC with PRC-barrel domain